MENKCSTFKQLSRCPLIAESAQVDVKTHEFRLNLVRQNTRIIDQSNNWNVLLLNEAYHIKEKCPILNNGVKASWEMQLF